MTGGDMNTRDVVIFSGERFVVPQCIQRIDHLSTHGWQLRYGGTKLFSDHSQDGSGARRALALATKELLKRIATLPAPSRLRRTPRHGSCRPRPRRRAPGHASGRATGRDSASTTRT